MGVSQRRCWGRGSEAGRTPARGRKGGFPGSLQGRGAWLGEYSQVPSPGGSKAVHSWISGVRDSLWARPPAAGNPGWVFLLHQLHSPPPQTAHQHHLLRVSLAWLFSCAGGSLLCTFRTHLPCWPAVAPDHLIAHDSLPHPTPPTHTEAVFLTLDLCFPRPYDPRVSKRSRPVPSRPPRN